MPNEKIFDRMQHLAPFDCILDRNKENVSIAIEKGILIMKKNLLACLCSTALLCSLCAVPALAAEETTTPEREPLIAPISQPVYSLTINGSAFDLGEREILSVGGHYMLPLRAVAEALGFTVTWDNDSRTVHVSNGRMESTLSIGQDTLVSSSVKAIGMTAPAKMENPNCLVGDYFYVQAEAFNTLIASNGAVTITGNNIAIVDPAFTGANP